jgi:CHASE3 domain sensor protein
LPKPALNTRLVVDIDGFRGYVLTRCSISKPYQEALEHLRQVEQDLKENKENRNTSKAENPRDPVRRRENTLKSFNQAKVGRADISRTRRAVMSSFGLDGTARSI